MLSIVLPISKIAGWAVVRCGKFKSVHTFLEATELIRSTKGCKFSFQKHDLRQMLCRRNWMFEKKCRKNMLPHVGICKKNTLNTAILTVWPETYKNDIFLAKYMLTVFTCFIRWSCCGPPHSNLVFTIRRCVVHSIWVDLTTDQPSAKAGEQSQGYARALEVHMVSKSN